METSSRIFSGLAFEYRPDWRDAYVRKLPSLGSVELQFDRSKQEPKALQKAAHRIIEEAASQVVQSADQYICYLVKRDPKMYKLYPYYGCNRDSIALHDEMKQAKLLRRVEAAEWRRAGQRARVSLRLSPGKTVRFET